MKKISLFLSIWFGILIAGCSNLPDEQFVKYAVITRNGFNEWNLPYNDEGEAKADISISVSGTSILAEDMEVEVAVNPEILKAYNFERFKNDTLSYYSLLPEDCYELETTKAIVKAGNEFALIPVKLNLNKMNKYLDYVLPVEIVSVSKNSVGINGYNESLMNFVLKNEYSGMYSMSVELSSSEGNLVINGEQPLRTVNNTACCFNVAYLDKASAKNDYVVNLEVKADSTLAYSTNNPNMELTYETPNKGKNSETNIIEIRDSGKKSKTMKFYVNYSYMDKSNPEVVPVRRNIRGYFLREVKIEE